MYSCEQICLWIFWHQWHYWTVRDKFGLGCCLWRLLTIVCAEKDRLATGSHYCDKFGLGCWLWPLLRVQTKTGLPQGATIVKLVTTQAGSGKPTTIISSAQPGHTPSNILGLSSVQPNVSQVSGEVGVSLLFVCLFVYSFVSLLVFWNFDVKEAFTSESLLLILVL